MITLVEKHIIKPKHPKYPLLKHTCWLSKNLYNATLYAVRQQYFTDKTYLNYQAINKQFTHQKQVDYVALPAKVAKHTQKLVDQAYRSFFALLKRKQRNPEQYKNIKVKIPAYLHKDGCQVVHYEKGALSFKKSGFIKLSKLDFYIPTKLNKQQVQFVRIVPKGNHIVIEVGYKTTICKPVTKTGRYASIDIGLNNLAAVSSNVFKPFLVNGKPLKSINQFFNKYRAIENKKIDKGLKTSRDKLYQLSLKRKNKLSDYLHKASRYIVNHLAANNIDTLVIGKNIGWKQDINIGRINNQNFVQIPFENFISQLVYKCMQLGIEVVYQEESYTSKCSFFDNEQVQKQETYLGKRSNRGLFKTASKMRVNSDINGSLNILRKYLVAQEAWNNQIWLNLVEASSTPSVLKITPSLN